VTSGFKNTAVWNFFCMEARKNGKLIIKVLLIKKTQEIQDGDWDRAL
jgi:hypothetical protein